MTKKKTHTNRAFVRVLNLTVERIGGE